MILSLFPTISPISPASAIFPALFVIVYSAVFDLVDDYKRYRSDQKANNNKTKIWFENKW